MRTRDPTEKSLGCRGLSVVSGCVECMVWKVDDESRGGVRKIVRQVVAWAEPDV